ncbi:MAG TPA: CPBP family intramembrane metalloprotease [Anaerolineae bacterium]|nr:CPBP family intramembrane metalloprotease [Anaerolineae bacterium]
MSIIRNDTGEVRLAWRLVLVILLFIAAAILLRLIPIRLIAVFLVRNGMFQANAIETASTMVFEDPACSTAVGALNGLIGFLIVWFLIRVIERSNFTWEAVGLNWRHNSPIAILQGVMLALSLFIAIVLTGQILGFSASSTNPSVLGVSAPIFFQRFILYLAMGFGEEIVFRGYVQTRLVRQFSVVWGVLATSVLFTLLHQISYRLSPVVILSGVMLWTTIGVLYHLSNSLYLVGVFHGTMNTLLNALNFEVGDISSLFVHALALCLAIGIALFKIRGSGIRSNPV